MCRAVAGLKIEVYFSRCSYCNVSCVLCIWTHCLCTGLLMIIWTNCLCASWSSRRCYSAASGCNVPNGIQLWVERRRSGRASDEEQTQIFFTATSASSPSPCRSSAPQFLARLSLGDEMYKWVRLRKVHDFADTYMTLRGALGSQPGRRVQAYICFDGKRTDCKHSVMRVVHISTAR